MTTIDLVLPKPYPLQCEIALHPAIYKVIAAGRRVGKTTMGALIAVGGQAHYGFRKGILDGRHVTLSSTSQDQSDLFWLYITQWLRPLYSHSAFYKNETKRIIRLGNGQIRVKTGRHADALRGDYADTLILDECAYLEPDVWQTVGMPMLLDSEDSEAWFLSTPKRRNWFYQLFLQGLDVLNPLWHSWNFPSHANPHLSPDKLAEISANMTEADYEQEIMAQFLESEGAVFRYVDERSTAKRREPYVGQFVLGVDWGQQKDYTVIMVIDVTTKTVVDYDRFNIIDFTLQRGRLKAMWDKWNPQIAVIEENAAGKPNIEMLQREGMNIAAFYTSPSSKPPLIESLVLAFDRGEITSLDDMYLKNELKAYEKVVSKNTGRSSYSAPEGLHDDCVMAMALAWHGCMNMALEFKAFW